MRGIEQRAYQPIVAFFGLEMLAMRSKLVFVPLFIIAVIVISAPILNKYRPYHISPGDESLASNDHAPHRDAPPNHFPTEEQRLAFGTSNVWETLESTKEKSKGDEVLNEAASHSVFVLLKTGAETMWSRIPVLIDTTLKRYPNHMIYSDLGAVIRGKQIIDVLQYLPEWALNSDNLLGYRVRRASVDNRWGWGPSSKLNLEQVGWKLDRYKNIPAFLHAWKSTNGEMPWYFMVDDDTYMLSTTLAEVIKGRDPDDILYIGHWAGHDPMFAHGGSGILMSRGAMKAVFQSPNDSHIHEEILNDYAIRAQTDCCGDSVVAYEFERLTNIRAETNLEMKATGLFQGNAKASMRLNLENWCTPVGSFHHNDAYEIQELFEWERTALDRKAALNDTTPLLYADFYEDFIQPFILDRHEQWFYPKENHDYHTLEYKPETVDTSQGDDGEPHEPLNSTGIEEHCARKCQLHDTCLTWEWHKDHVCRLYLGEIMLGKALNEHSPEWVEGTGELVVGHMVDRIEAIHTSSSCRSGNYSTTFKGAGWFYDGVAPRAPAPELKTRPLKFTPDDVDRP